MNNEADYQARLIKKLETSFPGCLILKNDPNYIQGVPDLMVLYKKKWAALECKRTEKASHQPNQDYYVSTLNNMSFASFVFPENEEEVFSELQSTFRPRRKARVS